MSLRDDRFDKLKISHLAEKSPNEVRLAFRFRQQCKASVGWL